GEVLLMRGRVNLDVGERILTIFQSRREADIVELEEAIQSSDLARVQRIAHRLKGACANAGATSLSTRANELWTAANKDFTDLLAARFVQFRQEWKECAATLTRDESTSDQPAMASF